MPGRWGECPDCGHSYLCHRRDGECHGQWIQFQFPDFRGSGAASAEQSKPHFTSRNKISAVERKEFTFTVTAVGTPTPTVWVPGTLPPGLSFRVSQGKGILKGALLRPGTTPLKVDAASSAGITTQIITLVATRSALPPIASYNTLVGRPLRLTLPNPSDSGQKGTISCTGAFPTGLKFARARGGLTGTLSGEPITPGVFTIKCLARNSAVGLTQHWILRLSVNSAATALSCPAQNLNLPAGDPFSSKVTVPGSPTPTLSQSGKWPPGVGFIYNGNGSASVAGTVTVPGNYNLRIRASSAAGSCNDVFRLTITSTQPAFESAASAVVKQGRPLSLAVITSGFPSPVVTVQGAPPGLRIEAINGTDTIVGDIETAGTFSFTLIAKNTAGMALQHLTLRVPSEAPSHPTTTTSTSTTTTTTSTTTTTTTAPRPQRRHLACPALQTSLGLIPGSGPSQQAAIRPPSTYKALPAAGLRRPITIRAMEGRAARWSPPSW